MASNGNAAAIGAAAAVGALVGGMAVKYADTKREKAAKQALEKAFNAAKAASINTKKRKALAARNNGE